MMDRSEAKSIVEKVLSLASADHVTVRVTEEQSALTRFANNAITQNVENRDRTVRVEVAFGQKKGSASVNGSDGETLRDLVRRAEEVARLTPEDPEYLPPPGAAKMPALDGFSEPTAAASPEARAKLALLAIQPAAGAGLNAAGIVSTGATTLAIGNNAGLFGFHRGTDSAFSLTAADPDGASGWVRRTDPNVERLGVEAAAAVAIDKARESADPVGWPAGRYTVVLEPAAVSGLIAPMSWVMSARDTFEGRTFLSGKLGEKLVSERVSLATDPFEPRLFGRPWFGDGFPSRKVTWIDRGKFVNLHYDQFTAKEHGVVPTPAPYQLVMTGGSGTVGDLVASIEKGILITHFWYIRFVDPMKMLLTGMTRDGLFRIEDGKLAGGLKNFRWNMSTLDMLTNIEEMADLEVASDAESGPMVVPALKVADWNFTSETSF